MKKLKGNFNGEEKEYDVILTFHSDKQNKNYIVYTDNNYDAENKLKIFAAIYDESLDDPFVGYPDTEEEWDEISLMIDKTLKEKD